MSNDDSFYYRALQVEDEVFERIQEEHFDRLRRCLDDRKAAFEILCGNSQMDEADKASFILDGYKIALSR